MGAPQLENHTGRIQQFSVVAHAARTYSLKISYKGKDYTVDTLPALPELGRGRKFSMVTKYGFESSHFIKQQEVAFEVGVDYDRGTHDAAELARSRVKDEGPVVISPEIIHPRAYLAGRRPRDPDMVRVQMVGFVTEYLKQSGLRTESFDAQNR